MNWLKFIFSPEAKSQPDAMENQIFPPSDQFYHANSGILDGLQFSATLQIRTPLEVLKHHGEVFKGPPSLAPHYGSEADGIWTFKSKTFRDLGIAIDDPEFTCASDIGPVLPSVYLPFLVQFREVVESDLLHADKVAKISSLKDVSNQFDGIWQKLAMSYAGFPQSFFYLQFTNLPGVGEGLAKRIYDSGLHTLAEISEANIGQLISIPGLGKITAEKIKAAGIRVNSSDA